MKRPHRSDGQKRGWKKYAAEDFGRRTATDTWKSFRTQRLRSSYLPQHLMTEDGRTVFGETAQAFSHLHEMEAQIEKLNKELETRTDYESDSYMALIEEVSSLSEKFLFNRCY